MTPEKAGLVSSVEFIGNRVARLPQLADFRQRCAALTERDLGPAESLHRWSVEHYRDFWATFLTWSQTAWEGSAEIVCTSDDVESAVFFPGVRLNYAENLLRPLAGVAEDSLALTSLYRDGTVEQLSRSELRRRVQVAAGVLAASGVGVGDRVVVVAANNARAVVATLAVTALGAAVSTAMPAMGPTALHDRFEAVEPVVLVVDRSSDPRWSGAEGDTLATLIAGLPSLVRVLVLDDSPLPDLGPLSTGRLPVDGSADPPAAQWPRVPFNSPLFILFTSGTTGPPKAMVHGVGGTLLEHVKEHRLHNDLRPEDVYHHHTTTAWMVWNRQLSALATGAHIVLDERPVSGPESLWQLVAEHGVTVFGTSPAYLQLCQDSGYRPAGEVDLSRLRVVLSQGSVLHDWQFDWFAEAVGDLPLWSSSGGTDILGAFLLSHPELPVPRGRLQTRSLGMDVVAMDEYGAEVVGVPGELVCRNPFPSRPVQFLHDPRGELYHAAYFEQHPGMWTHGDLIDIAEDGTACVYGRSDGVLNVDGVRIGPAEIYAVLRVVPWIVEVMAVQQRDPLHRGGSRLVLLVVLKPGHQWDAVLAQVIRALLRQEASPAHVPSVVLPVPELPVTHNGKPSERAARAVLDGEAVPNLGALRNPGSLAAIAEAAARQAAAPYEPAPLPSGVGVQEVVAGLFRDAVGVPVTTTTNFFDAGGTSRQSMRLLRRLRVALGNPVPIEAFLADPTIAGLSAAIAEIATAPVGFARAELLRTGHPGEPPLFVVHGRNGDVDGYRAMTEQLTVGMSVYGISDPSLMRGDRGATIVDIAATNVQTVRSVVADGPVLLLGYSFGGLVAFEMARQMAASGQRVDFLGLLDVRPPRANLSRTEWTTRRLADLVARAIPGASSREPLRLLRNPRRTGTEQPAGTSGTYHRYHWGPYVGAVTFFRASRRVPIFSSVLFAWRRIVKDMTVMDVPGGHHDILISENASGLAAVISEAARTAAPNASR